MTDDENTKKRLGDFEIIRELGRGGMGVVYEARQVSLNRKVALKVISGSLGLSSKAVLRFQREAEAAGKLHHTNIVPIYSTGNDDGAHYYAMELIDGPSLHEVIRSLRRGKTSQPDVSDSAATTAAVTALPASAAPSPIDSSSGAVETPAWVSEILGSPSVSTPAPKSSAGVSSTSAPSSSGYFDTVATMIAGVADALDYAHENGVIHRDIKPANLLLSKDGRVSINDFGLARMLEQPGMTMSGEFVGSPLYMSPEQITAGRAPLDHRTDIYSLGATLYELLTLKPPFPGQSRDEVIAQIIHKEPLAPRRHKRKVPVDLETICLKAIERDPGRRYQTAGQFAEDLRRYVNRFAIVAKRAGPVGRLVRWTQRHPALAALLALVLVSASAAGAFAWHAHQTDLRLQRMQLEQAQEDALLHAMSGDFDAAELSIEKAEQLGASTGWVRLLRGQVAYHRGEYDEATRHLEQAVRLMPESAAAYGLLTVATLEGGDEDRALLMVQRLLGMRADGFQDLLFKGRGLWRYPEEGLRSLDQAIALRPSSPVARLVRTTTRRELAMKTGRLEYARLALDDAEAIVSFLPENPVAIMERLLSRLVYANILEEAGDDTARTEAIRLAAKDAGRLAAFPEHVDARWGRVYYFDHVGDFDEARRCACAEEQQLEDDQSYLAFRCAGAWFAQRNYDKALAAYEKARGRLKGLSWFVRAYIRIEMSEDPVALLPEFRTLNEARGASSRTGLYQGLDWTVFRMLGETEYAAQVARHWREFLDRLGSPDREERWLAIAAYTNGALSADETLAKCAGDRVALSGANYMVAMDALGNGDRAMAAHHFRKCLESDIFYHYPYYWSRTFLARLEEDPTWPPWIPVKEGAEAK